MKLYSITQKGYRLAHSIRQPAQAEWKVIAYLAKRHTASREQIIEDTGADVGTIANLAHKGVIKLDTTGVSGC